MSRRPLKYRTNGDGTSDESSVEATRIRGPNSALTEFLRQQGISAEEIRRRHLQRTNGQGGDDIEEEETIIEDTVTQREESVAETETTTINASATTVQEEEEEEELQMKMAARRKRRAAKKDSDEYTDSDEEEVDTAGPRRQKKLGDDETCAHCFKTFTISVYSKNAQTGGYLCQDCTQKQIAKDRALKKNQLLSRKKRQQLAMALLDRQEVRLPSLQDLAIKKVSEKIEYVDQFGDIGFINMRKIAKILCKNRSLTDNTLQLFLDAKLEKLEFWDCSGLTKESYDKLAAFCPNLRELSLLMCGRFHNDNLNLFGSNLKHLTKLELDGPFLINDLTWQGFFKTVGKKLKTFKVSNTHRFSDDTFLTLMESCGQSLTELKLSRLDGIKHKDSYDSMPIFLTNLESLEITYPHHENLVDNSLLINLLSINGQNLHTLILDGSAGLTDEFLVNGIRPFCSNLRKLSLCLLDQITSEGFVWLFNEWTTNLGLNEVYLTKCYSLGDEGIIELLLHSSQSLVELSINSVKDLTISSFQIMKCPNLTYLDVGFVRSCDDIVLQLLGENCPQLKVIDCYGNNRCTSKATIRKGLKVIGRQSDTI